MTDFKNPSPEIRVLMVSELVSDQLFYEPKTILPEEEFLKFPRANLPYPLVAVLVALLSTLNCASPEAIGKLN